MIVDASILVNGLKQRFYPDNIVYLKDNTQFLIEIFNKSTRTVIASITINGEQLKASPVIMNGQKYVLRDFIKVSRKFLFHVYEVDSNNIDVKNAIRNNGLIVIRYFYEKQIEQDEQNIVQRAIVADETIEDPSTFPSETGKILKGEISNQRYKTVSLDWERESFLEQIIQLLPISKKPKTLKCPKCGLISKSEVNYCAKCGHSFFVDLPF